jgi:hypothetical protein
MTTTQPTQPKTRKFQPTPLKAPREPALVFHPIAWLKLQFFLHAGDCEIASFGVSAADDLLYIDRFETVGQRSSWASVELEDDAVADYFDRCVDQGLTPRRFARLWLHTHPGDSPLPSMTDERTFARVFGHCDWSVMFILARGGASYARLQFSAGPGGAIELPVRVDWANWPRILAQDPAELTRQMTGWMEEYRQNVRAELPVSGLVADEGFMEIFGGTSGADTFEIESWVDQAVEELHALQQAPSDDPDAEAARSQRILDLQQELDSVELRLADVFG